MKTARAIHRQDLGPHSAAPRRNNGRRKLGTAVGRAMWRARRLARRVAARLAPPKLGKRSRARPERRALGGGGGGGLAIEMWRADDDGIAVRESRLQAAVFEQFAAETLLDATDDRVAVEQRTVRLSGTVKSYLDKRTAERAARRLAGVARVCNEIAVVPPSSHQRSDSELVRAVSQVLEWNVLLAHAGLQVTVIAGWIRLAGELRREAERCAAEETVERLVGVRGVKNLITLRP
jgi:osmotically-inducible protein OsmY